MIAWLAHLLSQQQMATGMIGAALVGSLVISLKAFPAQVWKWFVDQVTVTLIIEGTDPAYEQFSLWFSREGMSRRARQLMLAPQFDYQRGMWAWLPTLGRGWHLRWRGLRPLLIHRSVESAGEIGKLLGKGAANHRLTVMTPGRSQSPIVRIIRQVEDIFNRDGLVRVYFWTDGYYRLADQRAPRSMDTVFLPRSQKARIVADIERFLAAKAAYGRRGTPYRRGYLLEGPPGTGKTSLIFALAGLTGRDVYAINLANVQSDNGLMAALNDVPPRGMVVIEDIDAAQVTRDRKLVEAERKETAAAGMAMIAGSERLTLSGLLNAVDGLAARENRILFVTTNAPEKLDPALLRTGRIDVRERIDLLDREAAFEMYRAFSDDGSIEAFERLVAPRLPLSGSDLQALLQAPAHELVSLDAARRRA
jgi:hypothetical protein